MRDYQKELEALIAGLKLRPKLLLHGCCAPCSSYALEYLRDYFDITLFFYNPNIYPVSEYDKRLEEARRLCSHFGVDFIGRQQEQESFLNIAKGRENLPEGGIRCRLCYELRLEECAKAAREMKIPYFTTTLTISPLKDADVLNKIGEEVAAKYGVNHLPSNFKKRQGYKRSLELCKELSLYRQNYCGCEYSMRKEI